MKKILVLLMCFACVFNVSADVNRWYLKDTVRYDNMQIKNVFLAPYLLSPRVCAYFSAENTLNKADDIVACAMSDNGYYRKNGNGTGAYDQIFELVKHFYATGEIVSVYVHKNYIPDMDSSISKNELVGIGTCNEWCFGENIN
ncbi:subtilase family AB5 toxin binding subunit [Citrobacter sp. Cb027]|uniref:subtilase family AB5 toxin binding subunit n=1 Tax=Citrobacter sp. Cb027 TaxID=2985023 RepID=UPI00257F7EAC|nr:subtilase family AB5 toxin binding subunit [Citrobacter sp. Cb027]MDM3448008.1 subtilase family AB5 toxin binding subunit [Citrobacter sp. Cb027]